MLHKPDSVVDLTVLPETQKSHPSHPAWLGLVLEPALESNFRGLLEVYEWLAFTDRL
jgi:hypothetical protein